ncbi:MAG: hypothetical protein DMG76_08725 [Acidobacteria bacterium]|nr:MAG: hypothetical protein DMG76_08725 [Acidobacteriota bacterium]
MNTKKLMVAMRPNSAIIKAAVTIMIALTFGLACTSTTAYAKKKKVKYGTIEITTNPGESGNHAAQRRTLGARF